MHGSIWMTCLVCLCARAMMSRATIIGHRDRPCCGSKRPLFALSKFCRCNQSASAVCSRHLTCQLSEDGNLNLPSHSWLHLMADSFISDRQKASFVTNLALKAGQKHSNGCILVLAVLGTLAKLGYPSEQLAKRHSLYWQWLMSRGCPPLARGSQQHCCHLSERTYKWR